MPSQRNNSSAAILDAARSSVADVGLRRTTVADVARKAGVSRMTIYREYGDAAAVFHALLTREVGAVVAAARQAAADCPSGRERLVAATVRAVETCADHRLLQRLLDLDPDFLLPFVVERLGSSQRAVLAVLSEMLRDGIADGSIRPVDSVPVAAHTLLLTLQSFVFSSRVTAATGDPAPVMAELRRMLDAYLRPEDSDLTGDLT